MDVADLGILVHLPRMLLYLLVQPPAMNVSGQTSEESH